MEEKHLPLNFQWLREIPKSEIEEEAPCVEIADYQTSIYFPTSFYKPISHYISPRYFKEEK